MPRTAIEKCNKYLLIGGAGCYLTLVAEPDETGSELRLTPGSWTTWSTFSSPLPPSRSPSPTTILVTTRWSPWTLLWWTSALALALVFYLDFIVYSVSEHPCGDLRHLLRASLKRSTSLASEHPCGDLRHLLGTTSWPSTTCLKMSLSKDFKDVATWNGEPTTWGDYARQVRPPVGEDTLTQEEAVRARIGQQTDRSCMGCDTKLRPQEAWEETWLQVSVAILAGSPVPHGNSRCWCAS